MGKLEGLALLVLASVHFTLFMPDEAQKNCEESVALCRGIGDKLGEAKALNGLAVAFMFMGMWDKGIEHAKNALKLFKETDQKIWEGHELLMIADFLHMADQPK